MAPRKKATVAAVEESVAEAVAADEQPEAEVIVEAVDALDGRPLHPDPSVDPVWDRGPLDVTPAETPEGLHAEIGVADPAFEAPTHDAGVDPVVARGALSPTPALTVVHDMTLGSKRPEDGA